MIEINNLKCTGCRACESICPVNAISFYQEEDTFLYPKIDEEKCIKCNKCSKVCMIDKSVNEESYIKAYAGYSTDENIINFCSSGGFATALSLKYIEDGGIVCGVRYSDDYKSCEYSIAKTEKEVIKFSTSKYFQSEKNKIHREIEKFLQEGKKVLFFGCPCDVGGLHYYLNKEYENLLTVDLICTGVTSNSVYNSYKDFEEKKVKAKINFLNARSKKNGWFVPCLEEKFDNGKEKIKTLFGTYFGYSFLTVKRICCYDCQYKEQKTFADIRIGDFWGIKQKDDFWNKKGVSAILVKTTKGLTAIENINNFNIFETTFDRIVLNNDGLYNNTTQKQLQKREQYLKIYKEKGIVKAVKKTESYKVKLKRIIPKKLTKFAKKIYHLIKDKK